MSLATDGHDNELIGLTLGETQVRKLSADGPEEQADLFRGLVHEVVPLRGNEESDAIWCAELGCLFLPESWGRGYAAEQWSGMWSASRPGARTSLESPAGGTSRRIRRPTSRADSRRSGAGTSCSGIVVTHGARVVETAGSSGGERIGE